METWKIETECDSYKGNCIYHREHQKDYGHYNLRSVDRINEDRKYFVWSTTAGRQVYVCRAHSIASGAGRSDIPEQLIAQHYLDTLRQQETI